MKQIIYTAFLIYLILFFGYNKGYWILEDTSSELLKYDITPPPYHGVITYLINLDNSKGRLEYMMPKIKKLDFPFQRISAVNGSTLNNEEIKKIFDKEKYANLGGGNMPKVGTIGCSLSHINTWKKFLKSNYEYALILEDDVEFDPIALNNTIKQLIKNKDLWDITSFEVFFDGNPITIKRLQDKNLVVYLTFVRNAGAYLISRSTAIKLLTKSLPIVLPIDYYFTRGWELDLKFTGIEPRLARQNYPSSDIQQSSKLQIPHNSLFFNWYSSLYTIQSAVIRFLYNFKIWWQLHQS